MAPRSTSPGSAITALARSIAARFFRSPKRNSGSAPNPEPASRTTGRRGEELAARHLRRQGYRVLRRNFRPRHGGEIDLVCRDRRTGTLVFVEVKTRASEEFGRPLEAIAPSQQRRIAQGAIDWLRRLENPGAIPVRFDVVEVVDREGGPEITLIRDAFRTPDDLRLD